MSEPISRCPDAETLGSFFEGRLAGPKRAVVAEHVERCRECLAVISTLGLLESSEGSVADAEDEPVTHRGWWSRGAFVAAAAVAVVCLGLLIVPVFHERMLLHRLRSAVDAERYRAADGRLTGFPYAPRAELHRGRRDTDPTTLRARGIAGEVLMRSVDDENVEAAHRAGVAAIVAGNYATAVAKLRLAADAAKSNAHYWSDLSVALHARGEANGNAKDYAYALAAADHALRYEPKLAEALFNRAVALEALRLSRAAADAYNAYLTVDTTTPWAQEARSRFPALRQALPAGYWNEQEVPRLRDASRRQDDAAVTAIVRRFPEWSRRWAEVVLLYEWANAVRTGDDRQAHEALQLSRRIASLLRSGSGESLLSDAVVAIDRCGSAECRAALVTGHIAYYEARVLYTRRRPEEALPQFRTALAQFNVAGSPMAALAEYYVANCFYDRNDDRAAHATLDRLLQSNDTRYQALRAQLLWQKGTIWLREGSFAEARVAFTQSIAIFDRLSEPINASLVRSLLATVQASVGKTAESWRLWGDSIAALSSFGDGEALQKVVDAIAEIAVRREEWLVALSMFSLLSEPDLSANPRLKVIGEVWGALAAQRMGWPDDAADLLREARLTAYALEDPSLRASAIDDLMFAEAVLTVPEDAGRGAALLRSYIERASQRGHALFLPEAHLELGRALKVSGDAPAAERALLEAISLRTSATQARPLQDSYFRTSEEAAEELAALHAAQGEIEDAWLSLERVRTVTDDLTSIHAQPRTLVVEYVVRRHELLIFAVSPRGRQVLRLDVGEAALIREVAASTARGSSVDAAGRLYRLLIGPLERDLDGVQRLVIVADRVLVGVPFSRLRDLRSGKYLIQRVEIVQSPSFTHFARRRSPLRHSVADLPALIVGNPAFRPSDHPGLERLPAAEREARTIASLYRTPTLLTANAATDAEVRRWLPQSSVVHIAAHAVVNQIDPDRSYVVLAPSTSGPGILSLEDMSHSSFSDDMIVVLAGCRTASGSEEASNLGSLALAAVAAGARNAIGAVADVPDDAAAEISVSFHRNLIAGMSPAAALRDAQLRMLRSVRWTPHAWGAFQLVGSGS